MSALDRFMAVYERHLRAAHTANPSEYCWRMRDAIARGSMSKDSPAFKATCKELGIKHTYTAIREYLAKPSEEATP